VSRLLPFALQHVTGALCQQETFTVFAFLRTAIAEVDAAYDARLDGNRRATLQLLDPVSASRPSL
jgi:hypothetical protein